MTRLSLPLFFALVACSNPSPSAGPSPASTVTLPAASGARASLSADAARVHQRLLVRDAAPTCAALIEGIARPVPALIEVAERAPHPPSASIVAASCVARVHATDAVDALERWVSARATLGLALATLNHIDAMDERVATRVVERALAGENADEARPRIERSTRFPALVERARRPTAAP